ncbi:hypothetical protein Ahy_B05g076678 [Arachis hypogaea]|uniref:Transmembrane protein n=1 Tax=Arachis hypogaea TaxID=3818 RepID=A0A444Z3S3_ARAHY|nr:hypothetical protein Ahy_B05g076678 [Arachis hypogaea]
MAILAKTLTEQNQIKKKMMTRLMIVGLGLLDFLVAGLSLMIALAFFALITSVLCAAAFYNNTKSHALGSPEQHALGSPQTRQDSLHRLQPIHHTDSWDDPRRANVSGKYGRMNRQRRRERFPEVLVGNVEVEGGPTRIVYEKWEKISSIVPSTFFQFNKRLLKDLKQGQRKGGISKEAIRRIKEGGMQLSKKETSQRTKN